MSYRFNFFVFLFCFFGLNQSIFSLSLKNNFVIGSLGDSITTATNAKGYGDRKESNWSTGTEDTRFVKSHYFKIKNFFRKDVKAINVAKAGATSFDLDRQVTKLLRSNPDYATLLVGANDVCSWKEDHREQMKGFHGRIKKTLDRLISHNSQIKILLVPVPDMYHLWELGSNSSCQWLWDMVNICPRLLSSSTSTEDRLKFKERLNDLNQSLLSVSKIYNENVKFDLALAEYKFSKEDISRADCFHPSLKGQNLISSLTWQKGWFKK